ncbi:hypothetical protein JW851_03570, partial [Candidatus Woesearchaeota archaeon]|nr:hypothetical protein [Candidatus Woesearchaeota archaeon]
PPPGGGGGGGGGGYAAFARTYTYDLESGMTFQRSLTPYDTLLIQYKGGEHQFKIADIKRDYANMLLDDKLYQFQNQQIQNFDLDNDHYYDMEAVLVQNYLTRAEFRIRPIHELIPGYNPFATPSTETIKQETKPEVKQEPKQEEQEEPEEEQEEPKQSTLSKFWNKAKGAGISITGAVTGISETEEKGGTTGIIILLAVIIAGIFLYWIYNEWF